MILSLLLTFFCFSANAAVPKKSVKAKVIGSHKNNLNSDISKKLDEKRKMLQLKLVEESIKKLEFEKEIAPKKQQIQKLKIDKELKQLLLENELKKEEIKTKKEVAKLKSNIEKLKLQAELLELKFHKTKQKFFIANFKKEQDLKTSAWNIEKSKLHLQSIGFRKILSNYIVAQSHYPDNPLGEDGILNISDRQVLLNGVITNNKADLVVKTISFFNRKNSNRPIFLIMDMNLGGNIYAGLKICNAITRTRDEIKNKTKAPVFVVIQSAALSMGAVIAAAAERSYAMANAQILHHQPSVATPFLNTSEHKYRLKGMESLTYRVLKIVASKMGITTKKFISLMYKNSPSGNWEVFADEAKKLKWIDHVIKGIRYTHIDTLPINSI